MTMKSLIEQATYPGKLRLVVYNQIDFFNKTDSIELENLNRYVDEVQKGPNPPSILIENVWHEEAKNVYYAR